MNKHKHAYNIISYLIFNLELKIYYTFKKYYSSWESNHKIVLSNVSDALKKEMQGARSANVYSWNFPHSLDAFFNLCFRDAFNEIAIILD